MAILRILRIVIGSLLALAGLYLCQFGCWVAGDDECILSVMDE